MLLIQITVVRLSTCWEAQMAEYVIGRAVEVA